MINKIYRLISPKQISIDFERINLNDKDVLVRPTKMSICMADQRYYSGLRKREDLNRKLPMALIHEAVGEVIYDAKNEFSPGDKVILIPNIPVDDREHVIKENYLEDSKFRASGYDGFMQENIYMRRDRIIKYDGLDENIVSFIELMSVSIGAIKNFEKKSHINKETIGVWGDGNVGFITSLILKNKYPNSKIVVFGKNAEKLNYFSFADEIYDISDVPKNFRVDHAFEAVGGDSSQNAIEQIIGHINPEGVISLLGVSENNIRINTRSILEKGITLLGNSRSSRNDFVETIEMLQFNDSMQNQLCKLISNIIDVNSVEDIHKAFELDFTSTFKTVINWNL